MGYIPVQPIPARQPHLGLTATRHPAASNEAITALMVHKQYNSRLYINARIGGLLLHHKTCSGAKATRQSPYIRCLRCPQHRQAGGSLSLSPNRFCVAGPGRPRKQGKPPTPPSSATRKFPAKTRGIQPPHSNGLLSGRGQVGVVGGSEASGGIPGCLIRH